MANPFAPKDIYGFQTLHREIGYYVTRLEQYEKSLRFFDEAIKKTPNDKRALIGRAISRSKAVQYEGALEDIEKALNLDPDDLVVLAEKSHNIYLCCEFEQGLISNIRLAPKREKPDTFKMGIMQCSDAIENCIGERAGRPLRDHFLIIRKLGWQRNYAAQKPFEPKPANKPKKTKKFMLSKLNKLLEVGAVKEAVLPKKLKRKVSLGEFENDVGPQILESLHSLKPDNEPIPKYDKKFDYRPLQRHTTNIENYMAEKYLDSMYLDKIFLRKVCRDPGMKSPNEVGTKKIQQLAKNCYKTVCYKQELLRTRRPFYFIKYQEAKSSKALKARQNLDLDLSRKNIKKEADILCAEMLDAYKRKDLNLLLHLVEKLKTFCESKPLKMLPNKNEYMEQIYDKVCSGFYEIYRLNLKQSVFQQVKRIYCLLGISMSRPPSRDSVVNQFKNAVFDYKKKIDEFSQRLENATNEQEVCWYYHELARFQFDTKHYELCRLYAKKCIKEAHNLGNQKWVFNCTMLSLKSNLAEHNTNDATADLAAASACAEKLNDKCKKDFVEICRNVVHNLVFDERLGGIKQLEKREHRIIEMMSNSNMKEEVAHLFRQMNAMPSSRRMSVVPGIRVASSSNKQDVRLSSRARKMSIMPTSSSFDAPDDGANNNAINKREISDGNLKDYLEMHI